MPDLEQDRKIETVSISPVRQRVWWRKNGMDGTTVEMIAERAGISPRTFFN